MKKFKYIVLVNKNHINCSKNGSLKYTDMCLFSHDVKISYIQLVK